MWQPWRWAGTSNVRAIENARLASVECSRRLLERTEIELYLAALHAPAPAPAAPAPRRPA